VFYKYRCAAAKIFSLLVKFLLIAPTIPASARGGRRRGGNNKVFGFNSINHEAHEQREDICNKFN